MPDENIVTVGESVSSELAEKGYRQRFSENTAYKAYDRYLAQEMRLADRLRMLHLFKDPVRFVKDTATKVLPGDLLQVQLLFEVKRKYLEADGIEDLAERLRIQAKNMDQMASLMSDLCDREKEAMEFIESVMARKARTDNGIDPLDVYKLAKEA